MAAPPPMAAPPIYEMTPGPAAYAPHVQPVSYPELRPSGPAASQADLAKLADVTLSVTVELGRTRLKVRELLALGAGSVVELDRVAGAPVDILVNGTLVARGDVVVVDDELGVRVSEVIDPSGRKS
jgi:flagellar motor switch protein FliN/FliY